MTSVNSNEYGPEEPSYLIEIKLWSWNFSATCTFKRCTACLSQSKLKRKRWYAFRVWTTETSLSLSREALKVLREHYQGKGKPCIVALYTELTLLHMGEGKTSTDYNIRVETAPTSLKAMGKVMSEGLLVIMTFKGLPTNYKTFCTEVMQRETQITFQSNSL